MEDTSSVNATSHMSTINGLQSNGRAPTMELIELPDGITPLEHQLAGHRFGHKDNKDFYGMLTCHDGTILKPATERKGMRERDFYDLVNSKFYKPSKFFSEELFNSYTLQRLKPLIPEYLGTVTIPQHPNVPYIHMVDITGTFSEPVTMDVKIGKQIWAPDSPADKIAARKKRCPHLDEICFQVLGAKYFDVNTGDVVIKLDLRTYSPDNLLSKGLSAIFQSFPHTVKLAYIDAICVQLGFVGEWFQSQSLISFFGSSVLVVLEGDPEIYSKIPQENLASLTKVRMIDFVHVWEQNKIDSNYIEGLKSLQNYLKKLRQLFESENQER